MPTSARSIVRSRRGRARRPAPIGAGRGRGRERGGAMRTCRRSVPVMVLAGALAAAPAASWAQELRIPKADVQYDQATDFRAFHTYAWKDTQERLPNPTRHIAMVTAIERELEKKGLAKARDGAPDV